MGVVISDLSWKLARDWKSKTEVGVEELWDRAANFSR